MRRTILVVDDVKMILEVMPSILKLAFPKPEFDIVVLVAEDGAKALQIFGREQLDVILSDVEMPVVDGLELLRKIRETSNVPFFLLTGSYLDYEKDNATLNLATDVIKKPVYVEEIKEKVGKVL